MQAFQCYINSVIEILSHISIIIVYNYILIPFTDEASAELLESEKAAAQENEKEDKLEKDKQEKIRREQELAISREEDLAQRLANVVNYI